ncbi:uncharacterized protein [Apostichopus japonicus]|uniref:uncharacterized protein n=1 Tax=Stichopus japonicus TaxID=307972 RepID=UPI003AB654F9
MDHNCSNWNSNDTKRMKRWPFLFWFILKFLGLFFHEQVVTERKCFSCRAKRFTRRHHPGSKTKAIDVDVDSLILAYEQDDTDVAGERTPLLSEEYEKKELEESCNVCETLWWNCDRVRERYTENEIGVQSWCRKWSSISSTVWLLFEVALLMLDISTFLPRLFAKPDKVLHLLIMASFRMVLLSPLMLMLCSKIRSYFKSSVPRLRWASSLNVFLVNRSFPFACVVL